MHACLDTQLANVSNSITTIYSGSDIWILTLLGEQSRMLRFSGKIQTVLVLCTF